MPLPLYLGENGDDALEWEINWASGPVWELSTREDSLVPNDNQTKVSGSFILLRRLF
jgi:hypothetical protein